MTWNIYLSGEIHTDWRDEIITGAKHLDTIFTSPVTDHEASDDCGASILGHEDKKFWYDRKGAGINGIRTKKLLIDADIVIVRFGEKYKQWNAAFEAGFASALGKSLIIVHSEEHQHALKEVDTAALAVTSSTQEVIEILNYVINGKLD